MNLFGIFYNNNLNPNDFKHQIGTLTTKEQNNLLMNYLDLNVYKLLNDFFRSSEDFLFPDFE